MTKMEKHVQLHVPWGVILIQAAEQWKASHQGKMPKTSAEKNEFKKFVKSLCVAYSESVNFEEAVNNAKLLYKPTGTPPNV